MKLARLWLANQGLTKTLHVKIRVAVEAKEETKIHAEIETQQKAAEEEEARLKAEEEVKMTTHSFVCWLICLLWSLNCNIILKNTDIKIA